MKVFISWSKPVSRQLGLALRDWLPEVIQSIEPWMSSEDIDKGQRWASEVGAKLGELGQGVLCITAENIREPWLNFEAGALAKSLDDSRVRPLLLGLQPSDVTGPLAQFQATVANDRDDMLKFITSLNESSAVPLDSVRLQRAFERNWEDFGTKLAAISSTPPRPKPTEKVRGTQDMVSELLDRMRDLQRSLAHSVEEKDLPRIAWPQDKDGYELKPGESVVMDGESGSIENMDRRGNAWVATVRLEKSKKHVRVTDISRLEWMPF
ncbi:hypothetical protein ACWCHM_32890 [Micromonospora sp. SCSIO 07396]